MKSTSEYIALLQQFKATEASKYGITKLGLFGSVARGEQKEGSDVDVYFESKPMGLFELAHIKIELEELLGCTVDLLRMRNQLKDTYLLRSITKDLVYV